MVELLPTMLWALGSTPNTSVVGSDGDGGGGEPGGPSYWVKYFHNRLGLQLTDSVLCTAL